MITNILTLLTFVWEMEHWNINSMINLSAVKFTSWTTSSESPFYSLLSSCKQFYRTVKARIWRMLYKLKHKEISPMMFSCFLKVTLSIKRLCVTLRYMCIKLIGTVTPGHSSIFTPSETLPSLCYDWGVSLITISWLQQLNLIQDVPRCFRLKNSYSKNLKLILMLILRKVIWGIIIGEILW